MSNVTRAASCLIVVLAAFGCGVREDVPVADRTPATIRALNVDVRVFNEAFALTNSLPHVVDRVDVVEGRNIDRPLSSSRRLVFDGATYREESVQTSGTLPACRICELLDRRSAPDPSTIERFVVDREMAFLNERSAGAFEYSVGPDTLVVGLRLETVHVRAIEDDPRAGRYLSATLYIDPSDETLLGISVEALRNTFFIREGGRRTAFVSRTIDGPRPRHASIVQRIRVLMGQEYVIHTDIHYSLDSGDRSPS